MTIKKKSLGFVLSLCIPLMCNAADIKVSPMTAEESAYFLKEVNRIIYSTNEGNTIVSFYDNADELIKQEQQSKLKITFEEQGIGDGVENTESAAAISFYPNPSKDVIFINGSSEQYVVEIYDMRGVKVLQQTAGNTVNVSQLTQGNYVLCVNKQYFKLTIQ